MGLTEPQPGQQTLEETTTRRNPNVNMELKDVVEAALFVSQKPLSVAELQSLFPEGDRPEPAEVREVLAELEEEFKSRPIELKQMEFPIDMYERNEAWKERNVIYELLK